MPIVTPLGITPLSMPFDDGITGNPELRRFVLAWAVDPQSGEVLSMTRSAHPVDAAVALGFQAELGSGIALGRLGNLLRDIKKADDTAAKSIEQEARRVGKIYVDFGWISVVSVDTTVVLDTGAFTLLYRNLFTLRDVPLKVGQRGVSQG